MSNCPSPFSTALLIYVMSLVNLGLIATNPFVYSTVLCNVPTFSYVPWQMALEYRTYSVEGTADHKQMDKPSYNIESAYIFGIFIHCLALMFDETRDCSINKHETAIIKSDIVFI